MPVEKYPQCVRKMDEIAAKYKIAHSTACRIIQGGHCMMFATVCAFNRADLDEMARVKKALHEAAKFALDQGGIPWKADLDEQEMIMQRLDTNALRLMKMIKSLVDPNGIMNPGNWETK